MLAVRQEARRVCVWSLQIAVPVSSLRHATNCLLHCVLQVDLSIINGEPVIQDGKLLTADLAHIIAEHNRSSEAICAHYTQAAVGA